MQTHSLLAVAVAYRRIAYVHLIGTELVGWEMFTKPATDPMRAAEAMQDWINFLEPEIVVTENLSKHEGRKGQLTRDVIDACARIASLNYVHDISVKRRYAYTNKFDEAEKLAKEYPAIEPWLPKRRRLFDNEPRNTVLFEALSLAHDVLERS